MAARGSERIVDAIEELILELPARVRGSRTKLSEQALGAVHADGRGTSVWDTFAHTPGKVRGGSDDRVCNGREIDGSKYGFHGKDEV